MPEPRDLRLQIVDTGVAQWSEHGAAGFSVARIARELGVSTASPYRHFADRDGLLVAVLARAAAGLTGALTAAVEAAGPVPTARLRAATTVWVRHTRAARCGLADLARPEVDRAEDPAVRLACRRPTELVTDLVAAVPDTDTAPLARDVLAVLHGYASMPTGRPGLPHDDDLARAAVRAVNALLSAARRTRRITPDASSVSDDQAALF